MKSKNILIAGAGGFIGRAVAEHFQQHKVLLACRTDFNGHEETFVRKYETAEVIMNFTGTPVIRRWTRKNKEVIMRSRIEPTRKLGLIISRGKTMERHYITASAIGIYPDNGIHTEGSKARSNDFLNEVVESWEREALEIETTDCPVCILRIGVVLGKDGGMLKRVMPVFKMGLGGRIGSGKQAFSWIHMQDLLRALEFIIKEKGSGIYNLVSPGICTNDEFTRELAAAVRRPAWFSVPGWILRLIYGKAAAIISGGPEVIPQRLIREGFEFLYTDVGTALQDLVN